MKNISLKRIFIFFAFVTISANIVNAGNSSGYAANNFAIMQPRAVKKAQKKQDKKEVEKKESIKVSSKESQKRSYEIQSPEVKKRMKQNKKEIAAREKAKKRNNNSRTTIGAKKYR